jgi:DNA modification methylase
MKQTKLMLGDNMESLKKLPDNSIDSVVTDPPYGLSFMNKKWDYDVPSVDFWKEVYRVLKPGGHVLSFGGTRTYHRMVVNMEDAGFEIRDQIMWIYGSGFPKSLNIGKAIDKMEGNEREVVGIQKIGQQDFKDRQYQEQGSMMVVKQSKLINLEITKGQSEFEGWGTALKPANEPICVARKPLSENTIAENVLKWKTGGINVDGCRIGFTNESDKQSAKPGSLKATGENSMFGLKSGNPQNDEGRFPANIIFECICDEVIKGEKGDIKTGYRGSFLNSNDVFDINNDGKSKRIEDYGDKGDIHTNPDCPCYMLDSQSGVSKSNCKSGVIEGKSAAIMDKYDETRKSGAGLKKKIMVGDYNDKGGASRFFYVAKVSKKERNMGLDGFEVEILTPTIKLLLKTDYNNKNFIWEKEDLKTELVDMDRLHQKDIEEYGVLLKKDKKWSTELYGSITSDQFLMDIKSIIEMETNLTTIYQTLNSLIQKNIKTNIQELNGLKVKDIKFVSDVENKNIKMTFILQNKDGFYQNVKDVELNEVWKLSVKENKCNHPTLKPINLLTYLCRLITPPGGIVLDPFMGSGSTGISAQLEGFRFVGMEMDPDYFKIAEARINSYEEYRKLIK